MATSLLFAGELLGPGDGGVRGGFPQRRPGAAAAGAPAAAAAAGDARLAPRGAALECLAPQHYRGAQAVRTLRILDLHPSIFEMFKRDYLQLFQLNWYCLNISCESSDGLVLLGVPWRAYHQE